MRQRHHTGRSMRTAALLALAAVAGVFLGGCSHYAALQDSVSFDMTAPVMIHTDQWARRGKPVVHVQAAEIADTRLTALFVPFRVTQPISRPDIIGYTEARTVWQTWLSMHLFSAVEFDGDHGPFRRDTALRLARAKGADLAIGGFVTYYYNGGSASDSQVAIQVEIYDAQSGQLVWSVGHSALMPASKINDYIIFTTKTRMPSDPMYVLTRSIAEDIGGLLAKWLPAPEDGTGVVGKDGKAGSPLGHPTF